MRIATYLSVLAAAGLLAPGCNKKDETPPKPAENSDPAPPKSEVKTPMPGTDEVPTPVPVPVPTPPVDPEPEVDPDSEPEVDPVPTLDAPDEAPSASAEHQAVFDKGLEVADRVISALEEAKDVDEAVALLEELEPDFKAIGEEMAAVGEPDEASAAAFNAQFAPLKAKYEERVPMAMLRLMNLDPAALAGGAPDPALLTRLQEDGTKLEAAITSLLGHFEGAWQNIYN